MRLTRRSFLAASSGLASLAAPAVAAPRFIAWHDRNTADHQTEYARLARNGFGTLSFCWYGNVDDPRFAAVMVPRPPAYAEKQLIGLTADEWERRSAEMAAQGWGPCIVSVLDGSSGPVLAGVFRPTDPLPTARHGLSQAELVEENTRSQERSASLIWLDSYGTPSRFAAIWSQEPLYDGWLYYPYEADAASLQRAASAFARHGVQIAQLALTPANGKHALFVDCGGPAARWRVDMSGAQYQAELDDAASKGLIPVRVTAKGSGNNAHFAAVFAPTPEPLPRVFRSDGPVTVPAVDAAIEHHMKAHDERCVALAILHRSRLIYAKGYTWAPRDYRDIRPTTHFRQASVSKMLAALAICQLMQERPSLTLETTMQSILDLRTPDGRQPVDPRFDSITIRHLLESTSGLDNSSIWRSVEAAAAAKAPLPATPDQIARFAATLPLTATPGDPKQTNYSNAGYFLLSYMVATLRKAPSFTAALAPLLGPLQMTRVRTSPSLIEAQPPDEARYHVRPPALSRSVRSHDRPLVALQYGGRDHEASLGSGGISAAVTDIARITAMLAVPDRNPVFDRATLKTLLDNAVTATRTLSGPRAHGYYGFDHVRSRGGDDWSYSGRKGGSLPGTATIVNFRTDGFSYIYAGNGFTRKGVKVDWLEAVSTATTRHTWPSDDLFPHFGMASFPLA